MDNAILKVEGSACFLSMEVVFVGRSILKHRIDSQIELDHALPKGEPSGGRGAREAKACRHVSN